MIQSEGWGCEVLSQVLHYDVKVQEGQQGDTFSKVKALKEELLVRSTKILKLIFKKKNVTTLLILVTPKKNFIATWSDSVGRRKKISVCFTVKPVQLKCRSSAVPVHHIEGESRLCIMIVPTFFCSFWTKWKAANVPVWSLCHLAGSSHSLFKAKLPKLNRCEWLTTCYWLKPSEFCYWTFWKISSLKCLVFKLWNKRGIQKKKEKKKKARNPSKRN